MQSHFLLWTALITALCASPAWADKVQAHASVLIYHHISTETPAATSTAPETFIQHLDLLQQEGFQVWPLDRVVKALQGTPGKQAPQAIPDKVAVITFDDAYRSVYHTAMPILKARNLPFTIFVNAGPVNRQQSLYMSWQQLREAEKQGAVIGNHSLDHPHMVRRKAGENQRQWLQRMRQQIAGNQQQLAAQLGEVPRLFAYPYGEFNPGLQQLLKEMGYVAFGQQSGPASRFSSLQALPRFPAGGTSANLKTLKTKLLAYPLPVLSAEPESGVLSPDDRRPSLTLTIAKGNYHPGRLRCYGPGGQQLQVSVRKDADQKPSPLTLTVTTEQNLSVGRSRYNCTAPHKSEQRWFWFSRQWILPEADGRWSHR